MIADVSAPSGATKESTSEDSPQRRLKILILNQAFHPDVVSTAQHASDLGAALAGRGHSVRALASSRRYDKPEVRLSKQEQWRGVDIRRIWCTGFGKKAKWRRAADFATFLLVSMWSLIWMPRQDVVIALTSPPLIASVAALLVRWKGGRLVFWVMDLNPDEAVAAGWLSPDSVAAHALQQLLAFSLRSSACVIALDRFMKDKLSRKGARPEALIVLPPWSHSDAVRYDRRGRIAFREEHGLNGKFVVMYSGNHSPCHPLDTLLEAARELAFDPAIHFAFIGGGSEYVKIQLLARKYELKNCTFLPYRPLEQLAASLSAADLHAVVMGEPFVGLVHPCKIYNVLEIGTPVLYIGPAESHIGDMVGESSDAWLFTALHGESARVAELIKKARRNARLVIAEELAVSERFSQNVLLRRHVEAVESAGQKSFCCATRLPGR